MPVRGRRVGLGLLLAMAIGAPARAQAPSDASAAETLFWDGRRAVERGDFETACEKFEASQKLDPAVGTLFNLANCEDKLGRVASAWLHYQQVVAQITAADDRLPFAKRRIGELDPRVPRLVVKIDPAAPPSVRVIEDDVELPAATFGQALPLDPGTHAVTAKAPGHEPRRFAVALVEGETREIVVAPGPVLPATAPTRETVFTPRPPAREPRESRIARATGWVDLGVGVAAAVLGTVAGAMVLREKALKDENCPPSRGFTCQDRAEGIATGTRGHRWSALSTVSFTVGASGIGLGLWLILTHPKPAAPSSSPKLGIGVRPAL